MSRTILFAGTLAAILVAAPAGAVEPLKVVASFSILGDLVSKLGGAHVSVHTLVGPNGDAHVYAPSPADARSVAEADLVVVNGLGFEGWLDRLVAASGYAGPLGVASDGVAPIEAGSDEAAAEAAHDHDEEDNHDHGGIDPHAWQSVANAETYVENIGAALCSADASNCADYRANGAAYLKELRSLDAAIRASVARIPPDRRKVITTHDAFRYFSREYGVAFLAPQGVSTESEASAGDIAALIEQVRREGVTAIFVENVSDPRLMRQIAGETGIRPGGELYSDALSGPDGPAATYLDMMRHNAALLVTAMLGS